MKCLVTGGAGFIGFHLSSQLIKSYEVIVVDDFNPYYNVKLKEINAKELNDLGVEVINVDILKFDKIREITKKSEIVFHLAAQPGVRYSVDNPLRVHKINVEGTLNLLEAARKNNISLFVNVSSSSVYGNCTELPIKESTLKNPISPYGLSKLIGEYYVNFYYEFHNLPAINLRLFTVIGARQRPDMGLYKFIYSIIKDKNLTIYGDGNQTRDWSNVKNVVDACLKLLNKSDLAGNVFNVGHGKRTSVNKVIKILEEKIGKKAIISREQRNIADPLDTQADISKIMKYLDYKPKYSIVEAIEKEIEYVGNLINDSIID